MEKVTGWKTKDGQFFENENAARVHEEEWELTLFIQNKTDLSLDQSSRLADFLRSYSGEAILEKLSHY